MVAATTRLAPAIGSPSLVLGKKNANSQVPA
jgi:hypothetical protein